MQRIIRSECRTFDEDEQDDNDDKLTNCLPRFGVETPDYNIILYVRVCECGCGSACVCLVWHKKFCVLAQRLEFAIIRSVSCRYIEFLSTRFKFLVWFLLRLCAWAYVKLLANMTAHPNNIACHKLHLSI